MKLDDTIISTKAVACGLLNILFCLDGTHFFYQNMHHQWCVVGVCMSHIPAAGLLAQHSCCHGNHRHIPQQDVQRVLFNGQMLCCNSWIFINSRMSMRHNCSLIKSQNTPHLAQEIKSSCQMSTLILNTWHMTLQVFRLICAVVTSL